MTNSQRPLRWRDVDWNSVTRDITVDGKRVRTVDLNPSGSDEVVIFLHGISASWRWFIEILPEVARTRRAIAIDLPGFGDSQFSRAGTSFDGLARAVATACAALEISAATVVGHSMGSIVATRLAVEHPELVERLVVTGGPILTLTGLARNPVKTVLDQPRSVATLLAELVTIGVPLPGPIARLIAHSPTALALVLGPFLGDPRTLDPAVMEQVVSALGAPGSFPVLLSCIATDPSVDLHRVTCPTRIIRGPTDPLSPVADVERFLRQVPTASVIDIGGTGHWPHIEKPERFLTVLNAFLDRRF
jgi:pimeloyl-ACP methyl ester carboxylesterase